MRRYELKLVPGHELEELETWSQRSRYVYGWRDTRNGTTWEERFIVDGRCIENIVGKGNDQRAAKIDALRKINVAEPAILTI
ncbi:hypothetical protein FRC12_018676 [Ceratobasidium sp. 428]|nr:hypothetical protein FRC12_018676 [Ceratobasidium sp. 428]